MITLKRTPLLIVVSAPSGAGKTTLCDRLVAEFDYIRYSVSCTTRKPREGEIHGLSYYFISEEEFNRRDAAGEFLERANVHGYHYGTLRKTIEEGIAGGFDVLMDIDVQGAQQIRDYVRNLPPDSYLRNAYVDIFIAPPSIEDLQLRLWKRAKDDERVIQRRLAKATEELARCSEYQYIIVNDKLEDSHQTLRSILCAEHHRVRPQPRA